MKNIFSKSILLAGLLFIVPSISLASNMSLKVGSSAYDLRDVFMADIYLDTETSTINAIETKVAFDPQKLRVVEVVDSDSFINFWIEKAISENSISLSGIVPGGFLGANGKIATILFETISPGDTDIMLQNTKVFLNDGMGTEQSLPAQSHDLKISDKISQNDSANNLFASDTNPPESFRPEVSRSTTLFDNAWFLVFKTTDKDSGVSHYAMKEARFRALMFFKKWNVVESPYILKDQRLGSFIAIKAIDKAGNETIERVYPENQKSVLETIVVFTVFAVLIFVVLTLLKYIVNRINRSESY